MPFEKKAILHVDSQSALIEIAGDRDAGGTVRAEAAKHILDDVALAEIAKNEEERSLGWELEHLVWERITSDQLLLMLCADAKSDWTAVVAATKLTSSDNIIAVCSESYRLRVRFHAIKRVDDQAVLAQIACDENPVLRSIAVSKLSSNAKVRELASGDSSEIVREAAACRLFDIDALANMAREDEDPDVRSIALDLSTLVSYAPSLDLVEGRSDHAGSAMFRFLPGRDTPDPCRKLLV